MTIESGKVSSWLLDNSRGQVGEVAYPIRQGGQAVAAHIKLGQVGEAAKPIRQGGQAVAAHIKLGQVGEVGDPLRQHIQIMIR